MTDGLRREDIMITRDAHGPMCLTVPLGSGVGGHRQRNASVASTHRLRDVVDYKGPEVYIDLDESGNLLGVEILTGKSR